MSTRELAETIGVAPSQLQSYCHHMFHTSFIVWRTHLRLIEACRMLLKSPKVKIGQICEKVGFKDPGNFCRAFKELFGITPIAWRREHRS
ncbi:MAG: AraC family transcriptional regulator [Bacteroidales bacterium]|nr:AraC family transcriptional regulator [Bacteroidales bacterium]